MAELKRETVLRYDMNGFPESDMAWISTEHDGYHQANLMLKLTVFEDRLGAELSCKGRMLAKTTTVNGEAHDDFTLGQPAEV